MFGKRGQPRAALGFGVIRGFVTGRFRLVDHMVCSKDVLVRAFFDMTVIGHTARRKDVLAQPLLDAGHVGLNLPENGNLDPQRPFLAILAKGDPVEGNVDSHLGVDIRFNAFIWGKVEKALPAPAQGYVAGSKGVFECQEPIFAGIIVMRQRLVKRMIKAPKGIENAG